ncbi:CFC_HP_G0070310.mRNA.1.CDS.1 [Saccharomyces cerevisiae]|nr:CFC_HP_G0070310.mRNA.1.CDS.1 [Saccharomyces cerevisiae]CAI6667154.1 CFC_HP_G0070310.mRNA.1.CDS.1 [Saccharomyces cerevisiae]
MSILKRSYKVVIQTEKRRGITGATAAGAPETAQNNTSELSLSGKGDTQRNLPISFLHTTLYMNFECPTVNQEAVGGTMSNKGFPVSNIPLNSDLLPIIFD